MKLAILVREVTSGATSPRPSGSFQSARFSRHLRIRMVSRPNSATGAPRLPVIWCSNPRKRTRSIRPTGPRSFGTPIRVAPRASSLAAPAMCRVPVAARAPSIGTHRTSLKRKSAARAGRSSPRQFPPRPPAKGSRASSRQPEMSEGVHGGEPPACWIAAGADAARPPLAASRPKPPAACRSTAGEFASRKLTCSGGAAYSPGRHKDVLSGDRLDVHDIAKVGQAFDQAVFCWSVERRSK
jgi:hypothetical protein